ncbi:hypothetical protein [Tengunoibacter tsumagoiensis]|uniref:DUF4190 domain-containing protein n=1 Tax=Tengunoibacter tsumagoiensis TaxID=2014871 RepID=A0A402A370_9CHLR|nr:hypothetical protein [Tengunoibacter tsumagoiensis]GCE13489.1 hypothetical protein KTT_33480 [Tengunoibacter tsumagoiensis]
MQSSEERPARTHGGIWPLKATWHPGFFVRKFMRRFSTQNYAIVPTEDQRNLVLTSFVLGGISLFAAFFPICGLPIAVAGLLLGLYGRRTLALRSMANWAVILSLCGLILTIINLIVTLILYFGTYLWE